MTADRESSAPVVIELSDHRKRGTDGSATGDVADHRAGSRSSLWLALALAVVGVLLLTQIQRADRLAERAQALAVELEVSRSAVDAYRSRMSTVRSHVSGLSVQLDELERLVEQDSEPPAEALP